MRELQGEPAVVTGAASGIGLATASHLAKAGMRVVLADVEASPLEGAVTGLTDAGHDALGVVTDVSDPDSVDALRDQVIDTFGVPTVLVNNAGVGGYGAPAWEQPLEVWDWVMAVNLRGVVHGTRSFVPSMIDAGRGHIVNVASAAGLGAFPFMAPYTASKFAVVGFTETLLHDLDMVGAPVGVSVVCPMFVRTQIVESHRNAPDTARAALPDDAALSDSSALLTAFVDAGIEADQVAAAIVEAVHDDRFWVITHPELLPTYEERTARFARGDAPLNPFG